MRERKAFDTKFQVITLVVGFALVLGVLAAFAAAGYRQAVDVLSLFVGIATGAGLAYLILRFDHVRKMVAIPLLVLVAAVIVLPIVFPRIPSGGSYLGIATGFVTMRLTWWLQRKERQQ
jgi:hypothetical protein